ncbi:MAG: mechanosensitive ion channel family protein [Rhizobiaceae bacterium]
MSPDLTILANRLRRLAGQVVDYLNDPWLVYQVSIVLVLFFIAKFVGARIMPTLERRARKIKGQPTLLRIFAAVMRRADWVIFVVFLALAEAVVRSAMPHYRSYLITIALSLSFAWLVVGVASRVIRNRNLARVVAWLAWLYAALLILGLDAGTEKFLDNLAVAFGPYRISVWLIGKAMVLLAILMWLALTLGNYLDERIQHSTELTPSFRVLVGKILKFGLILLAAAVALSTLGVDLTTLTVFSGAIGVGLGFGLQKVVSNFISGIIILADKSIKPGDTITLGDTFGWIRELRARFVSVVTRDGREYLIPNEDFITSRVVNWSFSDELVRLDVHFGVSYEADPHRVSELAVAAAKSVPRVIDDRSPVCWLTAFGESSLDFVLRFWIRDPQQGLTNVRGKVLLALWDTFKENGVEIPYPHRQVVLKEPVSFAEAPLRRRPPRGRQGPSDDAKD